MAVSPSAILAVAINDITAVAIESVPNLSAQTASIQLLVVGRYGATPAILSHYTIGTVVGFTIGMMS
jgi:hypothetical protein